MRIKTLSHIHTHTNIKLGENTCQINRKKSENPIKKQAKYDEIIQRVMPG